MSVITVRYLLINNKKKIFNKRGLRFRVKPTKKTRYNNNSKKQRFNYLLNMFWKLEFVR